MPLFKDPVADLFEPLWTDFLNSALQLAVGEKSFIKGSISYQNLQSSH